MRMFAGWALIALAFVVLFVEVSSLLDRAGPPIAGDPVFGPVPWYEHALWFGASAVIFAVGAWLARDWRSRSRRIV